MRQTGRHRPFQRNPRLSQSIDAAGAVALFLLLFAALHLPAMT